MSDDILAEMRATVREKAARRPKSRRTVWAPPDRSRFRSGMVLSIDQTLRHTGFALVGSDGNGWLGVHTGDCFDIDSDEVGFEGTLDKADRLEQALNRLMIGAAMWAQEIVHEIPAVRGYRLESSLMAAREVRRAAKAWAPGLPVTAVSNQAMKALLLPPEKRLEKKYVREAVEALIPADQRDTKRWNEHVHDAVALGLTRLYVKET
jgi:hypothetical protein